MPSPPDDQVITIRRGAAPVIPCTPLTPVDITGWSLAFSVSTAPGAAVILTRTVGDGITVTDAPAGSFATALTTAQTVALTAGGRYFWDVWRTDPGHEDHLAGGTILVKEPVRRPA